MMLMMLMMLMKLMKLMMLMKLMRKVLLGDSDEYKKVTCSWVLSNVGYSMLSIMQSTSFYQRIISEIGESAIPCPPECILSALQCILTFCPVTALLCNRKW